ncbi:MAG: ABC transporter ATP-binding protein [Planctomycetes bacterium]|nr:ABC transporter ATP-binding protein [Planctomycetota bacterium]
MPVGYDPCVAGNAELSLRGVRAGYGGREVLHGIDLDVGKGEVVALLGSNGAGKSTTLNVISGLVRCGSGSVHLGTERISGLDAPQIVRRGVVQVPEGRRVFPEMTVRENLDMGAYLRRDRAGVSADLGRVMDLFPVLRDRSTQRAGSLSGGEQQMLAMGRGLMSRPRVLLLDEPSLGLAPILVERIFGVIQSIRREGVSILLVEQNAHRALQVADRGTVLETGRVAISDTAARLAASDEVRRAYLGGT